MGVEEKLKGVNGGPRFRRIAVIVVAASLILLAFASAAIASSQDLSSGILDDYGISSQQVAGISDGYPDGTWRPHDLLLRKHFAKMAVRAFGVAEATPLLPTFTDVPHADEFYSFIEGASAAGLVDGFTDGSFGLDRAITRQQSMAIVARYVASQEGVSLATYFTESEIDTILGAFSDGSAVSPQLRAEVAFAVERGVVKGTGAVQMEVAAARLVPNAFTTRIQGAAMLIRAGSPGVPAITALKPNSGFLEGGNSVVITGTNFVGVSGASAVQFGGTNAISYVVNSATRITAVAPSHAPGEVQVQVVAAGGTTVNTAADDYTYVRRVG
jgi:hypothetical protein